MGYRHYRGSNNKPDGGGMGSLMPISHPATERSARLVSKTITFTGAAGLGATGNVPLFTVTGEILVVVLLPTCTVNLGEAAPTATIALGVTGATSFFIAATTATDIDAGDIWTDATPTEVNALAAPAGFKDI